MLSYGCDEIRNKGWFALRFDEDTALVVRHMADQPQPGRGAVNEGPEPDTLDDPLDPDEHAYGHGDDNPTQSSARWVRSQSTLYTVVCASWMRWTEEDGTTKR